MKLSDVAAIFHALDNSGAQYLVVGGLAVVAHGYVRYTHLDQLLTLKRAAGRPNDLADIAELEQIARRLKSSEEP